MLLGWAAMDAAPAVAAPATPVDDPAPATVRLQDSLRLTRLGSAVMPADGLFSLGLGVRTCSTVYLLDGLLERVSRRESFLQSELSLWPWLQGWAEVPWRTWSGGADWIPESGGGLGDGQWQVTSGRAFAGGTLHLAVQGGGNLPVGDRDLGLGEGVFSPRAGLAATMRVWGQSNVPEMRIHLNAAKSWNRAEETGYGFGTAGFEPWPPRYPAAGAVGGPAGNDAVTLGAALEFRRGTSSLWLEYSRDRFPVNAAVTTKEQLEAVGAGLRWGLVEGWAVHGSFLVAIAADDPATAWYPAYPDWSMSVAVSRQIPFGGRDRDHDGIVDRRDHCPQLAEDLDGWLDDDGCPEWDNDRDGIPDVRDREPNLAEDFDGFEDEDGAPDPDNDQDGVLDVDDLCPDQPEDLDGHDDDDGCPEDFRDRDGDGIEDKADACPDLPEDIDGFADQDGCPDLDNDLDGINDEDDACPDAAEDYDGDADRDGCPE